MSIQASNLLKRLAGAAPAAVQTAASIGAIPSRGLDFAALLNKASQGEVESGLKVTVSPRIKMNLSTDQLDRLSRAADQAEAAGIVNAVAVMDGMALTLDVQTRMVTGVVDQSHPATGHIDGVLHVPPMSHEQESQAVAVPLPGYIGGVSQSVSRLIASLSAKPTEPLSSSAT